MFLPFHASLCSSEKWPQCLPRFSGIKGTIHVKSCVHPIHHVLPLFPTRGRAFTCGPLRPVTFSEKPPPESSLLFISTTDVLKYRKGSPPHQRITDRCKNRFTTQRESR